MSNELANTRDNFDLLHPAVQERLYQMSWRSLRPIQSTSIEYVIKRSSNLIISAPTAGGKTEAAFLPIISRILDDESEGIRAVYVGPLKALINDQFRRLEDLCDRSGIPVHKWHGDVAAAAKSKIRKSPSGILLITPESIESLFINYADLLDRMFNRLTFVVIDELHSFLDNERGAHLRSLLHRLRRLTKDVSRLIGLSATFGAGEGLQIAQNWLTFRPADAVDVITPPPRARDVRFQLKGYLRRDPFDESSTNPLSDDQGTPQEAEADQRMTEDLFAIFKDHTGLIFGNSKAQLEFHADLLVRHCERLGLRNQYRVHHGSLSKLEREDTETALRSSSPTVAFCTSTLEMGIDVGNVKVVGQIGPPWSVASLTQRMGRSGRLESEAMDLRIFVEEDEPSPKSTLVDRLFPSLLQAVAMSQLLLFDKWSEPPFAQRICISTLVQQIMSVIAQYGGARPEVLFDLLIARGAFHNIEQPLFLMVLRNMGESDLIEQTGSGELILGLVGERIVRSKSFYAAFNTSEEYTVLDGGRQVGSIDVMPGSEIERFMILAGRRWRVVEIDHERRSIQVVPSKGGRVPRFKTGDGGDVHPRIRQKMRKILLDGKMPVYLDQNAQSMLQAARKHAAEASLDRFPIQQAGQDVLWFTWTGTKVQRTLANFAASHNVEGIDVGIALSFPNTTASAIVDLYRRMLDEQPTAVDLARRAFARSLEKYDPFLSEEIQTISFARNCFDVDAAVRFVQASLSACESPPQEFKVLDRAD